MITQTKRKTPSAKCPDCGKVVRVRPAGGDWLNAIHVVRHKAPDGSRCLGMVHDITAIDWAGK